MLDFYNSHGFYSSGASVDCTRLAAEEADIVIAQVNKNMSRTLGNWMMHINDIDAIVEFDEEIPELQSPTMGDTEKKIDEYCASLIEDESVLQLGIL